MADQRWPEPVDPLEAELRELGRQIEVGSPRPDLAAAVRARLEESAAGVRADRRVGRRGSAWDLVAVRAAAALVLVFAGLLVASPDVRAAVGDWLRFAGINIGRGQEPPVEPPTDRYVPLPGERKTSLAEAVEMATFEIRVPAELGAPDLVTVADGEPPRVVSLLYLAAPGRPAAGPASAGVAIRIDQFAGRIAPLFSKYIDDDTGETLTIGPYRAFWIDAPHPVLYVDPLDRNFEESARLSARSLIIEVRGTTVRIEGDLTKEQAIKIAESLG